MQLAMALVVVALAVVQALQAEQVLQEFFTYLSSN